MTKSFSSTPLWPYAGVVVCLLVLTILAPRTWRSRPLAVPPGRADEALDFFDKASTPDPQPTVEAAPRVTRERAPALDQFASPRQVAQVAPPVTERISFDPSVGDLPSLPEPRTGSPPARVVAAPRLSPPAWAMEDSSPAELARQIGVATPRAASAWPLPTDLWQRLETLSQEEDYAGWCGQVQTTLLRLQAAESLFASEVPECLARLDELAGEVQKLAEQAASPALQSLLLRTHYALQRRLVVWKGIRETVAGVRVPVSLRLEDDAGVLAQLGKVRQRLSGNPHEQQWRSYLLLEEMQSLLESGTTECRRELARAILARMESPKLNSEQAATLAKPPFSDFSHALRWWASEPVDYLAVLDDLEDYEEQRQTRSAHVLARHLASMRWSPDPALRNLHDTLNTHYRNANVRLAVSSKLVNRLLPAIEPVDQDINEPILGAWVSGTSRVHTELQARLIPDAARWRVGLEASGEVMSETAANSGPATFYNEALSQYLATKLLIVEPTGVYVWRAEARAASRAGLVGFRTAYDQLPIIGWVARVIALDQHDNLFPRARRVAEGRLAERASQRFDEEVHRRLDQGEKEFRERLLTPLQQLNLEPLTLDLHTNEKRLVGRYRLAANHQLGAHTPRPRAPSDSWVSVQLHESALNNTLEQLHLEGKRTDLRQLYRELADTFARPDLEVPEDVPEGVTVQFADEDAVRVRFEEGRVAVTFRIAELKRGSRHQWENFTIRAYYVPEPTQRQANLVREETIELSGEHITSLDRIALSGIFAKTLSRTRPFRLVNRRLAENKELEDLQVTQFVIADGWIGVAIGPTYGAYVEHIADESQPSTRR